MQRARGQHGNTLPDKASSPMRVPQVGGCVLAFGRCMVPKGTAT